MKMTTSNMLKVKKMLINKYPESTICAVCEISSKELVDLLFNKTFHNIRRYRAKLSRERILQVKDMLLEGMTHQYIAEELDIDRSLVSHIKAGRRYADVTRTISKEQWEKRIAETGYLPQHL